MDSWPLLAREPQSPFALITSPTPSLKNQPNVITSELFYTHVLALAKRLPPTPFAINLCENRYLFCVAFCATLLAGKTNLLPPNRSPKTLKTLEQKHEACYLVDTSDYISDCATIDLSNELLPNQPTFFEPVNIPGEQLAAICFTSGSTGDSKPIRKTWSLFYQANLINGKAMLAGVECPAYQLATVPAQHMWGLETSVHLPLHHNLVMTDAKPLYPADILASLSTLPEPRLLISTPIHLRTIAAAPGEKPRIARVLCATAPLSPELAQTVENQTNSILLEVYGCSEMGSMANRRTSQSDQWTLFEGFSLNTAENGRTTAQASHIDEMVELGDVIEQLDQRQFRLQGRTDDLINIGGKRGSLSEINRTLMQYSGIIDGAVFKPNDKSTGRLAAMVVYERGGTREELLQHFRDRLDPAFVPRPIISVDQLPRSDNGKLSRKALLEAYHARRR